MPRDDTTKNSSRDVTSTLRTGRSREDDTHRVTSEAAIFPDEEFVSFTNLNDTTTAINVETVQIIEKDGLWAWVACFCAILNQLLIFGTLQIYSLFMVEFINEFHVSTATAAWLGSMTLGLMKLFGPLASSMSMHVGNRYTMMLGAALCAGSFVSSSFASTFNALFGTLCVPYALGAAMTITPAVVIPLDYFSQHQSMAMGLVAAGSSLGTLLLAPLMQSLIAIISWRRTFRIHSMLLGILILVNMLIRPCKTKPLSYIKKPILRSLIVDLSLWKNRVFLLWVLAIAIVYFGYSVPNILLASYTIFIGGTSREASYIFMTMGGATTFSRLATGRFLKCDLLSRLHFKQIIFVLMGTSYLMLAHILTIEGLYVFAVVRGLLDGAHTVMLPMLTASMVGANKAILGWGYLAGAISVTYSLGPPAAGAIKDATGQYEYGFIMAGIPLIFSGLLLFLLPWAQRTGRSVNVLRALSQVEAHPADSDHPQRVPAYYLERVSPLGSIHDFIREEALISETGLSSANRFKSDTRFSQISTSGMSTVSPDFNSKPRSKSDTHFVLRDKTVKQGSGLQPSSLTTSISDPLQDRSKIDSSRRVGIRFVKPFGSVSASGI